MTDRPRYTAPMPDVLRHHMRAGAHPARSVPCPHCKARPHRSCHLRKSGRDLPAPHDVRVTDWARTTACCPECQVEPTIPCRTADGYEMPGYAVHARRVQEAEETCA